MSPRDPINMRMILLGQGEAQNYVKSTPEQPAVMRYPGEWKLPGGRREAGGRRGSKVAGARGLLS